MLRQGCNSRAHTCLDLSLHSYIFGIALRQQAIAYHFERCTLQSCLSEHTHTLPEDNLAKPPRKRNRLFQLRKMNKCLDHGLLDEILSQMMITEIPVSGCISHLLETLYQGIICLATSRLCSLN